jgi:hypothetical protein
MCICIWADECFCHPSELAMNERVSCLCVCMYSELCVSLFVQLMNVIVTQVSYGCMCAVCVCVCIR